VNKTLFSDDFLKKLEKLAFISKKIPNGTFQGAQKTYRKGSSLEFSDYRSYSNGDDIRSIDWSVWKRLGQFFVKLYSADLDRTISILIDTSESMGTGNPDKLTFSLRVAASLGYIGLKNQDRVGVISIGETVMDYMKPARGEGKTISLFNFLSSLKISGKTNLAESLKVFSNKVQKNGIVILLSDLFDYQGFKEGLYHLLYNRADIIILHILSEEVLVPDFSGPIKLIDSETEAVLNLTMDRETAEAYKKGISEYFLEVEKLCLQNRIEYIRVTSSTPFEDLILKYMRQGSGILLRGSR
jgi:uncharacterized protein (DUF58 family)